MRLYRPVMSSLDRCRWGQHHPTYTTPHTHTTLHTHSLSYNNIAQTCLFDSWFYANNSLSNKFIVISDCFFFFSFFLLSFDIYKH